jgi:hypothetical protein
MAVTTYGEERLDNVLAQMRVWDWILVAPQLGHATYIFAKQTDVREFVREYAATCRDDIRRNRGNVAARLGFWDGSCTAAALVHGYAS